MEKEIIIGMEVESENNKKTVNHDKEEMDIDNNQNGEDDIHEVEVRKKRPPKKSNIEVQEIDTNISYQVKQQFGLDNYNEEEDEDFDAEQEEDADDEGSEVIVSGEEDEFNEMLDDLADIDIVHGI